MNNCVVNVFNFILIISIDFPGSKFNLIVLAAANISSGIFSYDNAQAESPLKMPTATIGETYGKERFQRPRHNSPENTSIGSEVTPYRTKRQFIDDYCKLPPYPENGKYRVINGNGRPGDKIDINSILEFSCNRGYKLTTTTAYVICNQEFDRRKIPECARHCPAMHSTTTTILKCRNRNNDAISCADATDGSYMTYECIPFYEAMGYKKNILCIDGTWNYPKPVCSPVCGRKASDPTLIFGGVASKLYEYPWIVAIYRKQNDTYINNCGGSLISRRVVLTAAHCVTNEFADPLAIDVFQIGAGKYYNKYKDPRDEHTQYLQPSRIIVQSNYKGQNQHYYGDIALMVTKKLFILSNIVLPVCINDLNNINLHVGDIGEIAGWGLREDGKPSDELRKLEIPYKYPVLCSQELPREFADKYDTADKMCAGFYKKNISVCQGDSGSGLVFRNPEDNRYYIHGIVSLGPWLKGACSTQENALYTKVAFHFGFVYRELAKNYVEDCRLPPHPNHGKWILENEPGKLPGDIVPSTTILNITCQPRYRLSSDNNLFNCESSSDMPTCDLTCPLLKFPSSAKVSCTSKDNRGIDCSEVTEGSFLRYSCEDKQSSAPSISKCFKGAWSPPIEVCKDIEIVTARTTDATVTAEIATTEDNTPEYTGPKVICTYASWWSYKGVNPEDFDPKLCTHIIYAFAGVWPYGDIRIQDDPLDLDTDDKIGLFRRVTNLKKKNKRLKVLLSIGGSKASNASIFLGISQNIGKIRPFIGSAKYFINHYNFDGLNIDWHYPEKNEKDDYIKFLEDIKTEFVSLGYMLTASVRSDLDNTGYDPRRMSEILDFVIIKTFDMYGDWSSYTGQNSALYHSKIEYNWEKTHLNIHSCVNNWLDAGLSKNKLIMSIAFYARTFALKNPKEHGLHAPILGAGPGESGILRLNEICSQYHNYTEVWDDEQKNLYKYNDRFWFGYENKDSVWIKGAYVKDNNLLGVNIWPIDGDDVHGKCGRRHNYLKHVHGGLGNAVNWDEKYDR